MPFYLDLKLYCINAFLINANANNANNANLLQI